MALNAFCNERNNSSTMGQQKAWIAKILSELLLLTIKKGFIVVTGTTAGIEEPCAD